MCWIKSTLNRMNTSRKSCGWKLSMVVEKAITIFQFFIAQWKYYSNNIHLTGFTSAYDDLPVCDLISYLSLLSHPTHSALFSQLWAHSLLSKSSSWYSSLLPWTALPDLPPAHSFSSHVNSSIKEVIPNHPI